MRVQGELGYLELEAGMDELMVSEQLNGTACLQTDISWALCLHSSISLLQVASVWDHRLPTIV